MSKRSAIGLMSGTSMDGIDIARIVSNGEIVFERGPSFFIPYDAQQRTAIQRGLNIAQKIEKAGERPAGLNNLEQRITQWHIAAVREYFDFFDIDKDEIDLIGFHGQTVVHRPELGFTIQLGDGQLLAEELDIACAYDFRADDVAAGGQGAPLVPVYHKALAQSLSGLPIAFVNIGGVANITYVDDDELIAFDTGPGNALLDDFMFEHKGELFDEGGKFGAAGRLYPNRIAQLLEHEYFSAKPPKSLDRDAFDVSVLDGLDGPNRAFNLAAFTAHSIAQALKHLPKMPVKWVICGGGRHNQVIMSQLRELLSVPIVPAEDVGLEGDAIEAEAFAFLALRKASGLPISFPMTTGCDMPMTGGKLAEPK